MFQPTVIEPSFISPASFQHFPAAAFPTIHPIHWLHSHFAVGGWSPIQRLSGMLTAHMTSIAPHNGFTWHPHRGLEIYTWVLEGTIYHEDTTGGKGEIVAGELQRMFSGDWIEHQELNRTDKEARVIQIWFAADRQFRGVQPHYQQLRRDQLPAQTSSGATTYTLIGDGSPMVQHVNARLTATFVEPNGSAAVEPPRSNEDLFIYITDGAGSVNHAGNTTLLGQYDVILARPDTQPATISTAANSDLRYMSFYLPTFLN
ncbi:MAG: pirin family protein [Burkholderiales bacterium]|nr:pirin family protein [Anaerolineae bacterium]